MPHSIFFDMNGHAIHGFFDVKHLGSPVSHGCVRLSPDHAATLFKLVSAEGMKETTVVVAGRTPAGRMPEVARRQVCRNRAGRRERPTDADRARIPAAGAARLRVGPAARLRAAAGYAEAQVPPGYPPPPSYDQQSYYRQAQPYDARQGYYRQPVQPPPPQQGFFLFQGN